MMIMMRIRVEINFPRRRQVAYLSRLVHGLREVLRQRLEGELDAAAVFGRSLDEGALAALGERFAAFAFHFAMTLQVQLIADDHAFHDLTLGDVLVDGRS